MAKGDGHLLFVSKTSGYELAERDGDPPEPGSEVEEGERRYGGDPAEDERRGEGARPAARRDAARIGARRIDARRDPRRRIDPEAAERRGDSRHDLDRRLTVASLHPPARRA